MSRFDIEASTFDIEVSRFDIDVSGFDIEVSRFDIDASTFAIEASNLAIEAARSAAHAASFAEKVSRLVVGVAKAATMEAKAIRPFVRKCAVTLPSAMAITRWLWYNNIAGPNERILVWIKKSCIVAFMPQSEYEKFERHEPHNVTSSSWYYESPVAFTPPYKDKWLVVVHANDASPEAIEPTFRVELHCSACRGRGSRDETQSYDETEYTGGFVSTSEGAGLPTGMRRVTKQRQVSVPCIACNGSGRVYIL